MKDIKEMKIAVAIKPYSPMWFNKEHYLEENKKLCDILCSNRYRLPLFVKAPYGVTELEDIANYPYDMSCIWTVHGNTQFYKNPYLKLSQGRLPMASDGPYDGVYHCQTWDEFWNINQKIQMILDSPETEHEAITLMCDNGMIGNAFKKWTFNI